MSDLTGWMTTGPNVAAAIGTVGALWIGALTLRPQVNDKPHDQAAGVALMIITTENDVASFTFILQDDSPLPIYDVLLKVKEAGGDTKQQHSDVLLPQQP